MSAPAGADRRAPLHRFWRTVLSVIAWAALALAVAGLVSRFLPVTNHVVLILAALSPYLMACAVLSALLLLLGRRWWAAAAAFVVVAAAVSVELPMFVGSAEAAADSVPIRVLTANLAEGGADPAALVAAAADRTDLLVVEELTPQLADGLVREGIRGLFPHEVVEARASAAGVGIWSRYPLLRSIRIPEYRLGVVSAVVRPPHAGADVAVLAAHLAGPWPQPIDSWRRELATLPATMTDEVASAGGGAAIVAGDFNATIDMASFRNLLRNGFQDAVEQSGAGLVPSFPADSAVPPLIGIDHILTTNSSASDVRTVRVAGSDHLGLTATVHVPGQPREKAG